MLVLVLLAATSGPTPGPTAQKRVEGIGSIQVISDGGAYGIALAADSGIVTSATSPITITSGVVACTPASVVSGGCLTNGTQDIYGFKYLLLGGASMQDHYFAGRVLGYPGHQMIVLGDRAYGDTSAAVVLGNDLVRDGGGSIASFRAGPVNDMVIVTEEGNVSLSCGNAATTGQCSFVDATGVSGHITLKSVSGGEVAIQGDIGNPLYTQGFGWDGGLSDGGNPDGGAARGPNADGGATWPDGGTLYYVTYPYGGRHGDLTVVTGIPTEQSNSWVFQTKTPNTNDWFFVQRNGAFGAATDAPFANFGETAQNIITSQGQYYLFGDHASVLRFGRGAGDNDQRWAWKKENGGPADGGWGIIPDRAEVLRVVGQSSQSVQFGTSAFVGGSKTITFTAAFGGAPTCMCATSSATVPCSRVSVGTSNVTFNGTGTDAFDWICMGTK